MLLCLTIFYDLFRVQRAVTGMVFVFTSVLVDMACCSCSCFYSPLFLDEILQSWTKVLWHNFICGAFFEFRHAQPLPLLTNNVARLYPEFFSEYTTALSGSQGLLSRIVGSTLVCEKRNGGERWEATQGTRTLY